MVDVLLGLIASADTLKRLGIRTEDLTDADARSAAIRAINEVMHILAAPLVEQIHGALTDQKAYDREKHVAELRALPGSRESRRQRTLARTEPQSRHARRRRR